MKFVVDNIKELNLILNRYDADKATRQMFYNLLKEYGKCAMFIHSSENYFIKWCDLDCQLANRRNCEIRIECTQLKIENITILLREEKLKRILK